LDCFIEQFILQNIVENHTAICSNEWSSAAESGQGKWKRPKPILSHSDYRMLHLPDKQLRGFYSGGVEEREMDFRKTIQPVTTQISK
jgi:hypothetical protein